MIDINYLRSNKLELKKAVLAKNVKIDIDEIISLDEKRREVQGQVDKLRHQKNLIARQLGKKGEKQGLKVKTELKKITPKLNKLNSQLEDFLRQIPNLPKADVPVGKDEFQNLVIKKWGRPPIFNFAHLSHLQLAKNLDLVDTQKAAKVSGSRFYYLKNKAVILQLALINYAFKFLTDQKFIPIIPPVLIKHSPMAGMGYLEHGEESEVYHLKKDDLYLVGTAEQSIGPYHQDETIDVKLLPLRYVGLSTCFRREAGSYGKDVKGIMRVHQFDKVEMFSFTTPASSDKEHEYLLSLEEKLMQKLKIPYQVVKMCTADLGLPAARKYDIEAWIPSEKKYRETHSTSTCTDFQARRLNIRYRKNNKTEFVHTVNGTAFAIPRMLIAILENYQQKDGSVLVPDVLVPFTGFEKIRPKKS